MTIKLSPSRMPMIVGILCAVAAVVVAMWLFWSRHVAIDTPAPAIQQTDGSVVLQREPIVKPLPHQIPRGAKVERQVSVTIKPSPLPQLKDEPLALIHDCPPVTVDMSLIRMPDQTRRVVASSPDGQVIAGLDIPVESIAPPTHKWAAGIAGTSNGAAAWITRDLGRVRLIAIQSVVQPRPGHGLQPNTFVGAGWTF